MRGKIIDLDALSGANQDVIAVTGGGIRMNARGDILGPGGKVVKKIEQIQEEYNALNSIGRQQISIADTNKMKKFALKRQFLTAEEVQAQIAKLEKEKNKAKKTAEKVLNTTEMMANQGPLIVDNTNEIDDLNNSNILDKKLPKTKRTIIDSEE